MMYQAALQQRQGHKLAIAHLLQWLTRDIDSWGITMIAYIT